MKTILTLIACFYICLANGQVMTYLLSQKKTKTNEPSIAMDPKDHMFVLAGTNVDNVFVSSKTGMGWSESKLESKFGVYGDPVVHIASDTQYYFCHLSKTPGKKHPEMFDRIVFQTSKDRGETWNDGDTIGFNNGKMQDKPWIGVNDREKSNYFGRVYVSWTEFDKYESKNKNDKSRIRIAHTLDTMEGFTQAITVSDTTGNCLDGDNTLEGATTAIGKNGEVYVVWAGHNNIYFDKSVDGGDTFGVDKIIAIQKSGWEQKIPEVYRTNSMPFLKTNSKGHLFVVYGDTLHGDHDIFLIVSKDGGESWTPPIRVSSDEVGNGRDQYMPNMTIDKNDDKVYIVYYDRGNSSSNTFVNVTLASTSYGKKISYTRITPRSFPPAGEDKKAFFGDYIDVAAANGEIRPIYTDTEEGYITCKVGMLNNQMIKDEKYLNMAEYVTYYQKIADKKLILHYYVAKAKSIEIEMTYRGSKVFVNDMNGKFSEGEYEQEIDISKLQRGWHDLTIKLDGSILSRKVMIF